MGGGQTLRVLTTHPDEFAYVAIWSAGLFGGNADDWEKRNEAFLAAAEKVNSPVKRLEIVVGDQDFALAGSKALSEVLKKRGSSTTSGSPAAATPGSTGATTSPSWPRSSSGEAHRGSGRGRIDETSPARSAHRRFAAARTTRSLSGWRGHERPGRDRVPGGSSRVAKFNICRPRPGEIPTRDLPHRVDFRQACRLPEARDE